MTAYPRGSITDPPLTIFFKSGAALVDVDNPRVTIVDAQDTTVVLEASPTGNPATGTYEYAYLIPLTAPLGDWTATWQASYLGGTVDPVTETFTVVEVGAATLVDDDGPLVTIEQVTARIPGLTDDQVALATVLIDDASALARDIIHDPTITGSWRADVAGSVPRSVVPVVVQMIRRGILNPDGFTGETQQGYSFTGASGVSVFATPREASTLRRAARRGSPRSIDLATDLPLARRLL